ncbi:MAG: TetR family transcriptional regulator [Propionibacteriaceae bacterium]|jgi:AcrR family transcriptional regulator|nr:TetR family transcriptional regulator [Propionibacteriaceae bacterium]
MDLRVRKTLRGIRAALTELAKNKPLEQITVKELCEQALINKATFYAHYDNINALIAEIEDEFVKELTEEIAYVHLFFDDPAQFIVKLNYTFRELPDAKILFSSNRRWFLLGAILESLRRSIYKERPEIKSIPGIDMALTYITSGFSSVTSKHREESIEERAKLAGRATAAVLREFLNP